MRDRYDDGGFSDGSMERPALKQLLDAIRATRIDVIVVYKVDRLTRSLADFAKLVELFDEHRVWSKPDARRRSPSERRAQCVSPARETRLARHHLPALTTPSSDRQRNSLRTRDHVFNGHSFVGLMGEIGVASRS
jgi:Resolvase, N terminal domain